MKYLWTTFYVKSLDESITFYADLLGLKVIRRFTARPGVEIVFMGNAIDNETLVEFIQDSNNSTLNHSDSVSIGFAVESLEAVLEKVTNRNIPVIKGPLETSGIKFFFIKDPNDIVVQFVETIS